MTKQSAIRRAVQIRNIAVNLKCAADALAADAIRVIGAASAAERRPNEKFEVGISWPHLDENVRSLGDAYQQLRIAVIGPQNEPA